MAAPGALCKRRWGRNPREGQLGIPVSRDEGWGGRHPTILWLWRFP